MSNIDELDSSGDEFEPIDEPSRPVPKPKGLSSLSVNELDRGRQDLEQTEEQLLGDDVTITFELPNGEKRTHQFKIGRDFEYLKVFVEKTYDIPFAKQDMYYEGKLIPNVLCLNDVKGITKDKENIIVVKVRSNSF